MPMLKLKDGVDLFYMDAGPAAGQPIVFSHGWPLSSRAWDSQILFFGMKGFRVIAHDRRGHGRSGYRWDGNTMDQYADDLAQLLDHLNVHDAILVGHSTGGGEVVRYIGRHGSQRVQRAVLVSAVPPIMLKSVNNPHGTPMEAFDALRGAVEANPSQFFKDISTPFYGFNRAGATISEGLRQSFWLQEMTAGIKPVYDCIQQFSETDFSEDLKKMNLPTLVIHGDDDQIVPIEAAGRLSSKIIPKAAFEIYKGEPHGLAQTQPEKFNGDLLAFIES